MRDEVGQRSKLQQQTDAYAEGEAGDSADQSDDRGLNQELAFNVDRSRAQRFADANLSRALGDGDQHDVHDANASQREGQERDGSEEKRHHAEDALGKLRPLEGVPYPEGLGVVGVVVVTLGDDSLDLVYSFFVQVG